MTVSVHPTPPAAALSPHDVDEVRSAVLDARESHTGLRVAGRGLWLDAGRPVAAERMIALAKLSGIVEYVPGDLTLTARAGTSLAELTRATAAEGQWLGLDPHGSEEGTLGATVATASAGPLAHAYGTVRDLVLGFEAVTGTGDVVRGGGRVVKNVAGFDLTRLFTGSWGTLGVITEATVRLRAIPEVDETHALELEGSGAVSRAAALALEPGLSALALEIVNDSAAAALGLAGPALLARLAGNEPLVRSQRAILAAVGSTTRVSTGVWNALRVLDVAGGAVVRLSSRPSAAPHLWRAALAAASRSGGLCHASVGRGIARVIAPPGDDHARALHGALESEPVHVVWERAPGSLWPPVNVDPVRKRLGSDLRRAFDPDGVLNPGLLGGGE